MTKTYQISDFKVGSKYNLVYKAKNKTKTIVDGRVVEKLSMSKTQGWRILIDAQIDGRTHRSEVSMTDVISADAVAEPHVELGPDEVYVLWFSFADQYTSASMPVGAFTTLEAALKAKSPYHRIYKGKMNTVWEIGNLTFVK